MRDYEPPTVAILGADTMVGRALCVLLEGYGYQTTLLDAYPTGVVDELLDGALWAGPRGVATPAGPFPYPVPVFYNLCIICAISKHKTL
jgi:hypothetical protein